MTFVTLALSLILGRLLARFLIGSDWRGLSGLTQLLVTAAIGGAIWANLPLIVGHIAQ